MSQSWRRRLSTSKSRRSSFTHRISLTASADRRWRSSLILLTRWRSPCWQNPWLQNLPLDAEKRRDLNGHTVLCPNHKTYSSLRLLSLAITGLLVVAEAGFEPTTFGLWARRAARLLHSAILIFGDCAPYQSLIRLPRIDALVKCFVGKTKMLQKILMCEKEDDWTKCCEAQIWCLLE